MKKNRVFNVFVYIFLILMFVFSIFPILYTITASFKTNLEIMNFSSGIIPEQPTLENYKAVWHSENFNAARLLWNSVWYTVVSVVIILLTSSLYGYVHARGEMRGKKIIFGIFTALMFINLGSITLYPTLGILNKLHLNGSLWGLVIMQLFACGMVNVYIISSFIKSLPKEIEESAYIDGCDFIKTFILVIFPLLKSVLATVGILAFQATWNSYFMPTIITLGDPQKGTLISGVVALKGTGGAATSWNLMLAGSVIAVVPVLIAFAIGNKYFVEGIAAGAVKG